MFCPSCKHENRAGRKFFVHCDAGLDFSCPSCGASNEPESGSAASAEGERKQVTVLSADVKWRHAAAARAIDCLRVSRHD
jgi:transposase-like protein